MTESERVGQPAKLILREKEYPARPGSTVRHALQKAGIQPESVLITRAGELLTDDEILRDGDVIRLVSVISGGSVK
jgi:sulfur carrier protein ThiS